MKYNNVFKSVARPLKHIREPNDNDDICLLPLFSYFLNDSIHSYTLLYLSRWGGGGGGGSFTPRE